jgi:transposase-like protein
MPSPFPAPSHTFQRIHYLGLLSVQRDPKQVESFLESLQRPLRPTLFCVVTANGQRGLPPPSIDGDWPNLWIDAKFLKVRGAGRIVSMAVVIAVALNIDAVRDGDQSV